MMLEKAETIQKQKRLNRKLQEKKKTDGEEKKRDGWVSQRRR